jgi:hypothetical protein
MDEQEVHIRQEMAHTRAAMSTKAAMLQERVRATVEETESTVIGTLKAVLEHVKQAQDMIENVTSTVDTTMAQVQDIAHQPIAGGLPGVELIADMSRRPWIMVGAAILVGYILGAGGQPSPMVSPATAGSTSETDLDSLASNPTGHSCSVPTSSSVGGTSAPSPAPRTDAVEPQQHQPQRAAVERP